MKTRESAIENVKRIFTNTAEDVVSLQDAYIAWGRNTENEVKNKEWLSNKLTYLKYHNLVKPVYSYKSGRRKLEKLQLTLEGKRELGRIEDSPHTNSVASLAIKSDDNPLSIADAMKIVAKLRKENPDYEISFDVKLKSG